MAGKTTHKATGGAGKANRVMTTARPVLTKAELAVLVAGRTDEEIAKMIKNLLKPGAKQHPLDLNRMATMRMAGCSMAEIAAELHVHINTIRQRLEKDTAFNRLFGEAALRGKGMLRSKMFRSAVIEGNVTMMIWLGKQADNDTGLGLGQKDMQVLGAGDGQKIEITFSAADAKL